MNKRDLKRTTRPEGRDERVGEGGGAGGGLKEMPTRTAIAAVYA